MPVETNNVRPPSQSVELYKVLQNKETLLDGASLSGMSTRRSIPKDSNGIPGQVNNFKNGDQQDLELKLEDQLTNEKLNELQHVSVY